MKTETVRARVEPDIAISFEIKIPNKVTLKIFEDTDEGKNLVKHKTSKDMFKKLGI